MDLSLNNTASIKKETKTEHKVIIIGSGPAGLSAALYAARADLSPILLTGMSLGGQVAVTNTIENYPGFPDGVGGAKLGDLFQQQAEHFGARIEFDTVTEVDFSAQPYKVMTYSMEYSANSIIIATGASPNLLKVPGERELTGKGVSYCGTCDGWFFKEKRIVVVGGGDSALEEAIFLTRFASSVTVIHRRDSLRAGPILQRRAKENPKISFIWNSMISEIIGKDAVTGVNLINLQTNETTLFGTDGIFIFIGHTPNTQLFKNYLNLDDLGFIQIDPHMHTNLPGIYAAGEAADPHFRQVVTSAGMGAAAAIEATHYLESA